MGESTVYLIYWESGSAESYLYGSDIRYLPDRSVRFSNLMMPSGCAINQWTSFCNFQADRHEPQLPLLEEDSEYGYRAYYQEYPEGTVLLRFDFFDQQGEKISGFVTDRKNGKFIVPGGTFRFTMQLVQGGSSELLFYCVEIFSEDAALLHGVQKSSRKSGELLAVVPQIGKRMAVVPDAGEVRREADVAVISPACCMLAMAGETRPLERLTKGYEKVFFCGKERQAEELAGELSKLVRNGYVRKWLSDE